LGEEHTKRLIRHLMALCQDLAKGRYGEAKKLFDLTKRTGAYPREVKELAESFGMMLVKVEAREFHLKRLIEQLQATKAQLELAREKLARENVGLKRSLGRHFSPRRIIGQSPGMRELLAKAEKVADTPVNVLITGETGTGKELIARALHYNGVRREGPFIALNCSAIPEPLLESELFGIEKGVATGVEKRAGRIEQAHEGTLFLDEIGDMPLASQAKILRVLEEREVVRVGGKSATPVDIRVVTATNKNLKEEIAQNRFRQDLYFRINVVHLNLPPLRERPDDIPLLLKSFLDIHTKRMGRDTMRFSRDADASLQRYPWPGNVRELENEVERVVALTSSDVIAVDDLSSHIRNYEEQDHEGHTGSNDNLQNVEKDLILRVIEGAEGNKTEAARRLGISREGLRKKMKRYGIG
jgi:transcriptional regulator with PAS, ATPase and Fis domain